MRSQTPSTWSVVTVANETPETIRRFVAWHLEAGARHIRIFFDDPNDPCIDMVAHLPQVTPTRCTPEFWQERGWTQDTRFTRRQNVACKFGYLAAKTNWVLNIDADELIYTETGSVSDKLKTLSADTRCVLVRPAEQVQREGPGDRAVFRQRTNRKIVREVYGDLARALVRNHGMVGHSIGKSFVRSGLEDFKIRQHFIQQLGRQGAPVIDQTLGQSDGIYLLHYFNRGYDDWRRKLEYRLSNVGFRPRLRMLLQEALAADDPDAVEMMYRKLHHIDDRQYQLLDRAGSLVSPEIDFDDVISRYF